MIIDIHVPVSRTLTNKMTSKDMIIWLIIVGDFNGFRKEKCETKNKRMRIKETHSA